MTIGSLPELRITRFAFLLCVSETEEMSIGSERPFEQKALRKALLKWLGGEGMKQDGTSNG